MANDGRAHVLAIGGLGGSLAPPGRGVPRLVGYALELSGRDEPRVCLMNTAMGDDPRGLARQYSLLAATRARVTHLELFPMPNVADPAELLLSQDVIFVGGGSVANMAAVWRVHELDRILRAAWQAGVVLAGVSAGAICWFQGGTTDSFGTDLRPFTAGLGFLAGSFCPHYNSEEQRRPLFQSLVAGGALPAGLACDDGAAVHFAGDTLAEVVADRPGACGYRVEPAAAAGEAAEQVLPTRVLPRPGAAG
ncbi:MAG TPA: peptidase E [Streptosporangiaceae bacterium]|jgi:peptidase E